MMTDVPFWLKQFSLLANVNFEHVRGIQKVINHQTKYVETMKENGLQGKDETRFFREVSFMNDILKQQMDRLSTDANEYINIEKSLKGFEDKFNAAVTKLDMKYRTAREKLCYQTRNVETQKKEYHKLSFAVEKAEIKVKMTNPADAIYETRKKLDELQGKTDEQMKKYNKHLEKWKAKFETLRKMSDEFETVYQSREEDRAKVVLTGLQNSIDLTMAGNYTKRESGFTRINAGEFVKDTLIQTESVTSPKFQEYKGETDRNLVYMTETKKTEVDTLRNGRSSPDTNTATVDDNTTNNHESKKTNIYVVVKAYEKQQLNQLNLKLGEHVTEILPANEDGYAYGHVIHGLLHKKKKGFYPVDHVVRLQEDAEESTKDDKQKKGKTKKRTKSARNGVGHVVGHVIVDPVTRFEDDDDDEMSRKNDVKDKDSEAGKRVESEARRRRREKKKKEEEDMVIELL